MKREPQHKQIFDFLLGGMTITPLEALHYFGCLNLRNRICEIAKIYGFVADREMIEVKTRSGVKRVMQYYFKNHKTMRV
jgi:hypothetical protein